MLATAILPRDESAAIQTDSAAIMQMSRRSWVVALETYRATPPP